MLIEGAGFGGSGLPDVIDPPDEDDRKIDTDSDNDGYPDVPDPFADPVIIGTKPDPYCTPEDIVECFYRRGRLPSGEWIISQEQLNQLMLAVYYDISGRPWSPWDWYSRRAYDTPLWDGYLADTGTICTGGQCYDRNEVNYIAQGMYSAKYEKRQLGESIVEGWNQIQYSHGASEGEIKWYNEGYDFYMHQAWFYYGHSRPCKVRIFMKSKIYSIIIILLILSSCNGNNKVPSQK